MNIDESIERWRKSEGEGDTPPRPSDAAILEQVRKRSGEFDRTVRARDRRELIAALLVLVVFAPLAIDWPWLSRIGGAVVLVSAIVMFLRMRRARRLPSEVLADRPIAEVLRAELAYLDGQIRLLETVLWWYVLPLAIGPVLIVAGMRGVSWLTLGYAVIVAAIGWGVYALNRHALRDDLRPRRRAIEVLLEQVER
jgi:hypothetical protein